MIAPKSLFEGAAVEAEPIELAGIEAFTPVPRDVATGQAVASFGRVWAVLEQSIRNFARSLVADRTRRDDLEEIAMVRLWRCDTSRYDPRDRDDIGFLYTILVKRMAQAYERSPDNLRRELERVPDDLISLYDPKY